MENELNVNATNGNVADHAALQQRLEYLERRERDLVKEKEEMEVEFGLKRAKLKDLFLQKEDELQKERFTSTSILSDKESLQEEILRLQRELDENKSHITVMSVTMDNMEMEKRNCEEELASLRQIMEETVSESTYANTKYEKDLIYFKKLNEKLELENQELKNQITAEKEGVLSVMTKTLAKKVGSLNAHSQSNENLHENLEDSMKKAQEDAEMLRSLVVPLEAEIKALKDKLRAADDKLRMYEAAQNNFTSGSNAGVDILKGRTPTEVVGELDERLKEINEDLKAEKSSRSDLEMYVAVLQTQKAVLQDDTEKLRNEMQEVCRLLEVEKREHNDLKQTWQKANDYFLESQRLHFSDLRRMQSLLTMEQKRQLEKMTERENERIEEEKRSLSKEQLDSNEKDGVITEKGDTSSPILSRFSIRQKPTLSPSKEPLTEDGKSTSEMFLDFKDFLLLDRSKSDSASSFEPSSCDDASLRGEIQNSSPVHLPSMENSMEVTDIINLETDNIAEETGSEKDNVQLAERIPNLTEAQFKALSDLTPEHEIRKQWLQNARSKAESITIMGNVAGKRLVSEKEWLLLQDELKKARDKLSRTCDMCSNYEAQLQKVQEHEKDLEKTIQQLEKTLQRSKDDLAREHVTRTEVEEKFATMANEAQIEVASLTKQLQESEKNCTDVKEEFRRCYDEIQEQLKLLTVNRDRVESELVRLQLENDSLVGKHSAHAQQMQNEEIELPMDPNDMHHLLLKLREELIAAKVAKEQTEETLRSEILFLKDHVKAEHQLKENLEDTLTQEIDSLRTQVGIYESIKQQLEEERKKRSDLEFLMKEQHQAQNSSKQIISSLQKQTEELNTVKASLEKEVHSLKCKVQALQVELENGEAVQRDFVKLSQSLQVQLEKIRDSETGVRWQHEEDIVECSNCKQPFHGPTRKKRHCRHCGKIFCFECTSKVVRGGPNGRPSQVCDVCHTLLLPHTAPYFSKEPPHTPD